MTKLLEREKSVGEIDHELFTYHTRDNLDDIEAVEDFITSSSSEEEQQAETSENEEDYYTPPDSPSFSRH